MKVIDREGVKLKSQSISSATQKKYQRLAHKSPTTFSGVDPMIIQDNLRAVGDSETAIFKRHLEYRGRSKRKLMDSVREREEKVGHEVHTKIDQAVDLSAFMEADQVDMSATHYLRRIEDHVMSSRNNEKLPGIPITELPELTKQPSTSTRRAQSFMGGGGGDRSPKKSLTLTTEEVARMI